MDNDPVRDGLARIEAVMASRVGACRVIAAPCGYAHWCFVLDAHGLRVAESREYASQLEAVRDLARILGVDL